MLVHRAFLSPNPLNDKGNVTECCVLLHLEVMCARDKFNVLWERIKSLGSRKRITQIARHPTEGCSGATLFCFSESWDKKSCGCPNGVFLDAGSPICFAGHSLENCANFWPCLSIPHFRLSQMDGIPRMPTKVAVPIQLVP